MSPYIAEKNRQKALEKAAKEAEQARLEKLEQEAVDEVLKEIIYQPSSDKSNVFVRAAPTKKFIAAPVLEYKEFPLYKLPVMSNYTFPQEMIELTGVKVLWVSSPSGQSNESCVDSISHLSEINETKSEQKVPNDLISKIDKAKNICKSEFLIACKNHATYSAHASCKDQVSATIEYSNCVVHSYESSKSSCLDLCGEILAVFSDSEI